MSGNRERKILPGGVPRPAWRTALLTAAAGWLSACAHQAVDLPDGAASPAIGTDVRVAACRDALGAVARPDASGLPGADIRVLVWNVQKQQGGEWRRDFDRLTADADFVLMQEASLDAHTVVAGHHATFAPGYRTGEQVTGVLTLSREAPLVRCGFTSREPWLRTPKSTSITLHALNGIDGTLAVVNVHAVNFSFGLRTYRAQFARILEILRDHRGPIILAGDFNTWRGRRLSVVQALASQLELEAVSFAEDERARFLGRVVDHVYVRDLALRDSQTDRVATSDHNPMTAVLAMPPSGPTPAAHLVRFIR